MDTRETNKITAGDFILHRGEAYRVISGDCKDCDMFNPYTKRCSGYCFRWPDMEGLAFEFIGDEWTLPDDFKAYVSVDVFTPRLKQIEKDTGYHYTKKNDK